MHPAGSRSTTRLLASLVALAMVAVAPLCLIWVAGTASAVCHRGPESIRRGVGMRSRSATCSTDRLTESVVVDVILRVASAAAWVAVGVIARHDRRRDRPHGPPRRDGASDVRGLGWSQRFARFVATGLIVVLPTTHAARAEVHAVPARATIASPASRRVGVSASVRAGSPIPQPGDVSIVNARYTVQAGDSVFQIAQRLTGADRGRTVAVAEQILDLNLDRAMTDGQRFTNVAYIEPGWVLLLPAGLASPAVDALAVAEPSAVHVVERGETLWSIAGDALGAPTRWPEIWEQNRGATMAGDRVFDDPDLIIPGWGLDLPVDDVQVAVPAGRRTAGRRPGCSTRSRQSPPLRPPRRSVSPPSITTPPTVPPIIAHAPPAAGTALAEPSAVDRPATVRATGTAMIDGRRMFGLDHAAMLSAGRAHPDRCAPTAPAPRSARPAGRVPMPSRGSRTTERALRRSAPTNDCSASTSRSERLPVSSCARDRQILAVMVDVHGAVEIALSAPCPADEPFISTGDRWHLAATTATDSLVPAARPVGVPCVSIVQLGVDIGRPRPVRRARSARRARRRCRARARRRGRHRDRCDPRDVGARRGLATGRRRTRSGGVRRSSSPRRMRLVRRRVRTSPRRSSEALHSRASRRSRCVRGSPVARPGAGGRAGRVRLRRRGRRRAPRSGGAGLGVVVAGQRRPRTPVLFDQGSTWRLDPLGIDVVPLGLDRLPNCRRSPSWSKTRSPRTVDELAATDRDGRRYEGAGTARRCRRGRCSSAFSGRSTSSRAPLPSGLRTIEDARIDRLAGHAPWTFDAHTRPYCVELDVRDATFPTSSPRHAWAMARTSNHRPARSGWAARSPRISAPRSGAHRRRARRTSFGDGTTTLARPAIQVLRPAVQLIRGMPFEGTSYLWPDAEGLTSNFVLLATSAASELARHHLAFGQIDAVFWRPARVCACCPATRT